MLIATGAEVAKDRIYTHSHGEYKDLQTPDFYSIFFFL